MIDTGVKGFRATAALTSFRGSHASGTQEVQIASGEPRDRRQNLRLGVTRELRQKPPPHGGKQVEVNS